MTKDSSAGTAPINGVHKSTFHAREAGKTAAGARRASTKSERTRAREFALQGLYQHLVGRNDPEAIDRFTRDLAGFHKSDSAHYDALLHGCIADEAVLDALMAPLLDRKITELSPIEHASLWIGIYEFQHCLDVPWRVVINECVEITKEFGGTDGHKYVNAVLNGLAPSLRTLEVAADTNRGRTRDVKSTADSKRNGMEHQAQTQIADAVIPFEPQADPTLATGFPPDSGLDSHPAVARLAED